MADRLATNKGIPFSPNKELWGQGMVNIFTPLFNGFPHTGALARTAVNIRLGAVSPLAGIAKFAFKLGLAAFLAIYLEQVPMACIGGILLYVATGMVKVKRLRTADCVVGGFRYASKGKVVGSLLLGLHDDDGKLNHVGFTSSFKVEDRTRLLKTLEPFIVDEKQGDGVGFSGNAPGGPSRWATERSTEWVPLRNKLVCEVQYDHFSGGRFRHGTKLLRWRPDKSPRSCTMDQLKPAGKQRKLAS